LEKSILAKRKAQKLARDGQVQQAIEEMRRLLTEADVDPYDHVYLGDLLMRVGEREDGIASYLEAVREYERVGLFRNAIAVGKKVLRIDPARAKVQRNLGELYDREGLKGEAVPHYVAFLDSFQGESLPPEDFYATLERAAAISGLAVEVALRLAEHWIRVRQVERAAEYLYEVADRLEVDGVLEMAIELRRRASEVRGEATGGESDLPSALRGDSAAPIAVEPTTVPRAFASSASLDPPTEPSSEVESASDFELDFGFTTDANEPAAPAFEVEPAGQESESSAELPALPAHGAFAFDLEPSSPPTDAPPARETTFDLDGAALFGDADSADSGAFHLTPIAEEQAPSSQDTALKPLDDAPSAEHEEVSTASDSDAETGPVFDLEADPAESAPPFVMKPVDAPLSLREEADQSFDSGHFDEARRLYQKLHREHPNEVFVLERLVEVSRRQSDRDGEVLYLGFLGDAWIQEEEMERALIAFEAVLKLDPENATAKRRVARFRELGVLREQEPPATIETPAGATGGMLGLNEAQVSVRADQGDVEKDEWLDLEGLLEEFKAGLKNHMDASDFQGHYDLALSHHQMGLLEEALEELDRVFACPDLPGAVAQPARELRGLCLTGLERGREAVHEFREAFDQAPEGNARRTSLYHLAKALEAVEEWQEASEKFELLLSEAPGFLDAAERLKHCQAKAGAGSTHHLDH